MNSGCLWTNQTKNLTIPLLIHLAYPVEHRAIESRKTFQGKIRMRLLRHRILHHPNETSAEGVDSRGGSGEFL
jgi:hypothetical protein